MAKGIKTGGRTKGTPNKDNPLKGFLRTHSMSYFKPDEKTGLSQFDIDMSKLDPDDRVQAELRMLKYHTPEMSATSVDMTMQQTTITIEDRLLKLSGNE